MRGGKNKLLGGKIRRAAPGKPGSVLSGDPGPPPGWWRSVMRGLGSNRRRRALATLQRLAQTDVEDTISEADIQTWLRMLEMESAQTKVASKPQAPAHRRPDRR